MLKVTDSAAEKLKEDIANQKNPLNTMLRIVYKGYG